MMTDTTDIINKALTIIGNPTKNCHFKNMFTNTEGGVKKRKGLQFDVYDEASEIPESLWMGIDWAKDSGMNRGDVISRNNNVIEVRFRTL